MLSEYAEVISAMRKASDRLSVQSYIVGGFVRDLLLGISNYDLDFTVVGDGVGAAKLLAKQLATQLVVHDQFMTAKVGPVEIAGRRQFIDVVTARSERYGFPGKLPQVTAGTIRDDLMRRDFSVNALALPLLNFDQAPAQELRGQVLDVCGGLQDLDAKLIRILHPGSFLDDPTRMYRACRYAGRMSMQLEADTERLLGEASAVGAINSISHFRRFAELERLCEEANPSGALKLAFQFGLVHQLGWYSKVHDEEVRVAMLKLGEVQPELRYGVALRILGSFALPADRTLRLQSLQQGKVFVRETLQDIQLMQSGGAFSKLSDAGVVAAVALGHEGGFKKEAVKRGLL